MAKAHRQMHPPGLAISRATPRVVPLPLLANRVLLAITSLDAEAKSYLEKVAVLAKASGARLRLAYCSKQASAVEHPMARLKQRARHLGRLLNRPVETVDVEIQTLAELRRQLEGCAVACIGKPKRDGRLKSWGRDVLGALIDLRIRPVLAVEPGNAVPYASTLAAVALGPNSPQLLRWARAMAPDSTVELLHVTEFPESLARMDLSQPKSVLDQALQTSRAALQHRLRELSDELGDGSADLTCSLVSGELTEVIDRRQRSEAHDLVVVGISSRKPWLPLLRPVLAQQLVGRLSGDLLVVPQTPRRATAFSDWEESL